MKIKITEKPVGGPPVVTTREVSDDTPQVLALRTGYGRTAVTIEWENGYVIRYERAPERKLVKTIRVYDDGAVEEEI